MSKVGKASAEKKMQSNLQNGGLPLICAYIVWPTLCMWWAADNLPGNQWNTNIQMAKA